MRRAISILGGVLAFGFSMTLMATTAQAGEISVVQGHPLALKGQVYGQGQNDRTGDLGRENEGFKASDLGAVCRGQDKLDKGQQLIVTLFNACSDPDDNAVQIVQTNPFSVLETIGSIDFGEEAAIVTEKRGDLRELLLPAELTIACGEGAVSLNINALAIVKFDSDGCVETVKAQRGTGGGEIDEEEVLVDRAQLEAKKKKASLLLVNGD